MYTRGSAVSPPIVVRDVTREGLADQIDEGEAAAPRPWHRHPTRPSPAPLTPASGRAGQTSHSRGVAGVPSLCWPVCGPAGVSRAAPGVLGAGRVKSLLGLSEPVVSGIEGGLGPFHCSLGIRQRGLGLCQPEPELG